jgi:diacylglycerol kinase family enzyme
VSTAILVNKSAGHGQAEKRWNRIKEELLLRLPPDTILFSYSVPFDMEECVRMLAEEHGVDCFISAGGDGSINWILNAVMKRYPSGNPAVCLGAVGLGSSNDFLKPARTRIGGVPVKTDLNRAVPADVGKFNFVDAEDKIITRYFIVNASIGITAEANLLFNKGDIFLDRIKQVSVRSAILYAALKTMIRYRNKTMLLEYDGAVQTRNISNISVVKNPNISGSFRYDQEILPGDGFLGLHFCHDMNKRELVATLMDLSNGRFSGREKRVSARVRACRIESKEMLALEADGEVVQARNIDFSLLPGAIRIAGD